MKQISLILIALLFLIGAVAPVLAAGRPQGQICRRVDVSGLSVPEVLFVWPEQAKQMVPYAEAAQTLHDAMDYLQVNYHQSAWDTCAYDGIVLVTPTTSFPTIKDKTTLRAARETTMFSIGDGFPIYVNLEKYQRAVLLKYQGTENKQKRIAMTALFLDQAVRRLTGSTNAGVSQILIAKLQQDGLLATPNPVQRGGQVAPAGYDHRARAK
jgi:hypothetical protein